MNELFSLTLQISLLIENSEFSNNGAASINIDNLSDAGLLSGDSLNNVLNDPTLVSGTGGAVSLNLVNSARYKYSMTSH